MQFCHRQGLLSLLVSRCRERPEESIWTPIRVNGYTPSFRVRCRSCILSSHPTFEKPYKIKVRHLSSAQKYLGQPISFWLVQLPSVLTVSEFLSFKLPGHLTLFWIGRRHSFLFVLSSTWSVVLQYCFVLNARPTLIWIYPSISEMYYEIL